MCPSQIIPRALFGLFPLLLYLIFAKFLSLDILLFLPNKIGNKFYRVCQWSGQRLFDYTKACLEKLLQLTDLATVYFCFLSFNVNTFKIGFIVYVFCLYVYINLLLVYQIACLTNLFVLWTLSEFECVWVVVKK